jgi:hypothetical protein
MVDVDCDCQTHLKASEMLIAERTDNLRYHQSMIKNSQRMVKELEAESKDPEKQKPQPCIGHGKSCPCTKMKERFTYYSPEDENNPLNKV